MPNTIPDLAWYVSTGLIVILMSMIAGVLGWGFLLLTKKLDTLTSKLDTWVVKIVHIEEKLEGHIKLDEEIHERIERQLAKAERRIE